MGALIHAATLLALIIIFLFETGLYAAQVGLELTVWQPQASLELMIIFCLRQPLKL